MLFTDQSTTHIRITLQQQVFCLSRAAETILGHYGDYRGYYTRCVPAVPLVAFQTDFLISWGLKRGSSSTLKKAHYCKQNTHASNTELGNGIYHQWAF